MSFEGKAKVDCYFMVLSYRLPMLKHSFPAERGLFQNGYTLVDSQSNPRDFEDEITRHRSRLPQSVSCGRNKKKFKLGKIYMSDLETDWLSGHVPCPSGCFTSLPHITSYPSIPWRRLQICFSSEDVWLLPSTDIASV